ncbi:Lycopene beta and epsilon cyclase [Isosphaera pallida ATCC 43644]|uniref:Lycopene beta and epsilon cyclase n=1 Tax=Isosphaera pallida (strain ATCC 43644 / DSM 9630 / IS1B) TaxID=575540 RepID=E8QX21_ISOPI|nr:Lycopene beta and epsilon cyclase [Isosphaera pallida ATCC 43644]
MIAAPLPSLHRPLMESTVVLPTRPPRTTEPNSDQTRIESPHWFDWLEPDSASGRPRDYDHVIVGAGAAGLSLAWALLDHRPQDSILLIDRRSHYVNDRTWCYWNVQRTAFDDLATHAWDRWRVVAPGGGRGGSDWDVTAASKRYRYLRLRAIDVYQRTLGRLSRAENVRLALGRTVESCRDLGDEEGFEVITSLGVARGRRLYLGTGWNDGRGTRTNVELEQGSSGLVQQFVGWRVRLTHPTPVVGFDPTTPILMDFRCDQSCGPHFLYVLPDSERGGLVESTMLLPPGVRVGRERHEQAIRQALAEQWAARADDYEILETEAGRIPMNTQPAPPPVGLERAFAQGRCRRIGLAGGAARPSSGYAFVRIQRQVRALARGLRDPRVAPRKYDFLDTIFLQVLRDHPEQVPTLFTRMFERTQPDALARFLTDASDWGDDLSLILALPKLPFLRAAARSRPIWGPLLSDLVLEYLGMVDDALISRASVNPAGSSSPTGLG